jgi:hypothetical protein
MNIRKIVLVAPAVCDGLSPSTPICVVSSFTEKKLWLLYVNFLLRYAVGGALP